MRSQPVQCRNVHEDVRARPSTCVVACFLQPLGTKSGWDERWGNSKSVTVRSTELMVECKDCLFVGWNEQTVTAHLERWPTFFEQAISMIRQK